MDDFKHIGDLCLGYRSRMASRAVTRLFDQRMAATGLRITQFGVLVAVDQNPNSSLAAIACQLDLEPSTLVRNLDVLQKRGLIARDGGRGRAGQRFRLTDDGQRLLAQALERWAAVQSALRDALGDRFSQALETLKTIEAAALTLEAERHE